MSKRDFYDILGVDRDATLRTLKRAWKRLAMEHHPDRNPGDQQAATSFREAKEAYEVLSDPEQRAIYDQFGHEGLEGTRMGTGAGFSSVEDIFAPFSDLFGDVFGFGGEGGKAPQPVRGKDIETELTISLEEAIFGCSPKVRIRRQVICEECDGTGAEEDDTEPQVCPVCHGDGNVSVRQGFFSLTSECSRCGGLGLLVAARCVACEGSGEQLLLQERKIKVPAGVKDGSRLRISKLGEPGRHGGPPGDVRVTVRIQEHPQFDREEDNLVYAVAIPFTRAILGGHTTIPTIDGDLVEIPIRPGTQSGDRYVVEGHGVPHVRSESRGDLIAQFQIELPREVSEEQRALLLRFEALSDEAKRVDEEPPTLDELDVSMDGYASLGDAISSAEQRLKQRGRND